MFSCFVNLKLIFLASVILNLNRMLWLCASKLFITSRCSTAPALRACAGQFLSRGFVVLLRKNIPQNHNLKTAAELGVM